MKWTATLLITLVALFFWLTEQTQERREVLTQDKMEENQSTAELFSRSKKETSTQKVNDGVALDVDLNETIDTLIDTNVTIPLIIKNAPESFLLHWNFENGLMISTREPLLTHSFSLGEHPIGIKIYDEEGKNVLWEHNITLRAWRYVKVETSFYQRDSEQYEYAYSEFFDHLKRLVLSYSEHYRRAFTYNEFGKVLEERYESSDSPESSYTLTYNYEGEKVLSQERVNDEGEVMESHLYDEEGKEIVKDSTEEETQERINRPKAKKFYNEEGNITRVVSPDGQYIINYTYKDGHMVYQERIYPKGKITTAKSYSEEGLLLTYDNKSLNSQGEQKTRYWYIYDYDKEGNRIKKEMKQYLKERVVGHVVTHWHYKDGKMMFEEEEALVGYCPCSADIVKSKTSYEYDKNGTQRSSKYLYQRESDEGLQRSKKPKEIRSYVNVLE